MIIQKESVFRIKTEHFKVEVGTQQDAHEPFRLISLKKTDSYTGLYLASDHLAELIMLLDVVRAELRKQEPVNLPKLQQES